MIQKSNSGRTGDKKMQKRKNRWYIAVAAVVILAVVLVLAVVPGKKGKNKKDPKMIEPTQQEQASEIPTGIDCSPSVYGKDSVCFKHCTVCGIS